MISLLAIDHQFKLGELLGDGQDLFLVDFLGAAVVWTAWLLVACRLAVCNLLIFVKRILTETARIAHTGD